MITVPVDSVIVPAFTCSVSPETTEPDNSADCIVAKSQPDEQTVHVVAALATAGAARQTSPSNRRGIGASPRMVAQGPAYRVTSLTWWSSATASRSSSSSACSQLVARASTTARKYHSVSCFGTEK